MIFKDNVCDQRVLISYLKGYKRANCSRELLQKDQVYSQVVTHNIYSYKPFLEKTKQKNPTTSQNPHTTAKPLFLIFHLHSNQIVLPSSSFNSKHWRKKTRHAQSHRMLSPAVRWAAWQEPHLSVFSMSSLSLKTFFMGILGCMCCETPVPGFL